VEHIDADDLYWVLLKPVPAFPNIAKSTNPFDLNGDTTSVQPLPVRTTLKLIFIMLYPFVSYPFSFLLCLYLALAILHTFIRSNCGYIGLYKFFSNLHDSDISCVFVHFRCVSNSHHGQVMGSSSFSFRLKNMVKKPTEMQLNFTCRESNNEVVYPNITSPCSIKMNSPTLITYTRSNLHRIIFVAVL